MNTIHKMKQKIKDYSPEIVAGVIFTSICALSVALAIESEKQEMKQKKELNDYIIKENRAGRTVLQLADGGFVGVAL